jgi:hypothetical protein
MKNKKSRQSNEELALLQKHLVHNSKKNLSSQQSDCMKCVDLFYDINFCLSGYCRDERELRRQVFLVGIFEVTQTLNE